MDQAAQDFWLDHLGEATRFNDWVFSRVQPYLGARVLEVGCGSGIFTALIAKAGHDVTGYDIHAPYIDMARARLAGFGNARVYCADATEAELDGGYDSVVLLDVLEHIADDTGFLGKLRRTLRPGGSIVLKVPAHPALFSAMDKAVGHYRRYSAASLARAFGAAGFSSVEQRPFNTVAALGWFLNGRMLGRTTPPADQIAAFERLVPVLRAVEDRVRMPLGMSLIAAARA